LVHRVTSPAWIMVALLICALLPPSQPSPARAADFKIVGYLPSWQGTVAELPLDKLTHVNYAFALPNESGDGGLRPLENPGKLSQLVSAAHARGVKVLIAVGGWNDGNDSGFERLAANPSSRTTFVNTLVSMVESYDLDGVDLDWEYPDAGTSASNYTALMGALSSAMHSRGKLLTAAVVAEGWNGEGVQAAVFDYVDFLNIMSYDGGSPHASYAYALSNVNYWQGRGLPPSKTVLGIPFYGSPGYFSYRQAVAADPSNANRDCATVQGTHGCYNGIPTALQKTDLMLQRGAGIMYWETSMDTTDGTSLVSAIYARSRGGTGPAGPTATPLPTTGGGQPPSVNVALSRLVSTSSVEPGTSFTANLAVDGSVGTRWSSGYTDPQWLRVDLGARYQVNRVRLSWEAAYGRAYQVQVSDDDASWTTIYSTANGDGGVDDLIGLGGGGRYVRLLGTSRATPWGYSLWELEVFGTADTGPPASPTAVAPTSTATTLPSASPTRTPTVTATSPVAATATPTATPSATVAPVQTAIIGRELHLSLNRLATASSVEQGTSFSANRAVDGNAGTRWSSRYSDPQWIRVDLGTRYRISRVRLNWEAAYARAYQIQVSDDGATWTTVYTTSSGEGGMDDVTGLSATGRHVRVLGTARATPWGYSLWDFEVYGSAPVTAAAGELDDAPDEFFAADSDVPEDDDAVDSVGDTHGGESGI
jgi:hypothetical protein